MLKRIRGKQNLNMFKREREEAKIDLIPPPNSFFHSSQLSKNDPKKNKWKQIHHQQSRLDKTTANVNTITMFDLRLTAHYLIYFNTRKSYSGYQYMYKTESFLGTVAVKWSMI